MGEINYGSQRSQKFACISPVPHHTLIGKESLNHYDTAGCALFSRTYQSSYNGPGQWVMIVKDGERKSPSSTVDYAFRSPDDDADDDD